MAALKYLALCFLVLPVFAQEEKTWEIDFLAGYYDQDGDHSAVTGGEGTESLQSASPVFSITFNPSQKWSHHAKVGFDNVTSASIDAMDNVSGASRKDNRVFLDYTGTRDFGDQQLSGSFGFSNEYDYQSLHAGVSGSFDFNHKNTTFAGSVTFYDDTIDLYDIDGVNQGEDTRETLDVSLSWTQVLSRKTLFSAEVFLSDQSGFLSSPFQEVILSNGVHVAERLPDARTRTSVTLKLNQAWTPNFIMRHGYRHYDDDFEIQADTLELEPYFRVGEANRWFSIFARFHQQDGSDYFVLPNQALPSDTYYTADRDLSTFDSFRVGVGYSTDVANGFLDSYHVRLSYYDRDDGLTAFNISFGFGWSR